MVCLKFIEVSTEDSYLRSIFIEVMNQHLFFRLWFLMITKITKEDKPMVALKQLLYLSH